MKTLFTFFAQAASDGTDPSSSRIIALAVVPPVNLVPLLVWAVLSVHGHAMLEFPATVSAFVASTNTLVLGALHLNKREETNQAAQAAKPPTQS